MIHSSTKQNQSLLSIYYFTLNAMNPLFKRSKVHNIKPANQNNYGKKKNKTFHKREKKNKSEN